MFEVGCLAFDVRPCPFCILNSSFCIRFQVVRDPQSVVPVLWSLHFPATRPLPCRYTLTIRALYPCPLVQFFIYWGREFQRCAMVFAPAERIRRGMTKMQFSA